MLFTLNAMNNFDMFNRLALENLLYSGADHLIKLFNFGALLCYAGQWKRNLLHAFF